MLYKFRERRETVPLLPSFKTGISEKLTSHFKWSNIKHDKSQGIVCGSKRTRPLILWWRKRTLLSTLQYAINCSMSLTSLLKVRFNFWKVPHFMNIYNLVSFVFLNIGGFSNFHYYKQYHNDHPYLHMSIIISLWKFWEREYLGQMAYTVLRLLLCVVISSRDIVPISALYKRSHSCQREFSIFSSLFYLVVGKDYLILILYLKWLVWVFLFL